MSYFNLVGYSLFTPTVQLCRADTSLRDYDLFERILSDLRSLSATNLSLLCRHLSPVADKRFSL